MCEGRVSACEHTFGCVFPPEGFTQRGWTELRRGSIGFDKRVCAAGLCGL